ncbi:LysR family transcriptional regulator [Roseomonas sp. ACRSG]|nr:LysR family transcriptional regulator [Roseomonas sp. ACRSG]
MRYDLTDLKLFRAIAELSSLSLGANKVALSAGSASYRLKNLEHTAGAQLFRRTPRGMDLTPAGQALLRHVTQVLSDLEVMHGEMSSFAKGMRGSIRLLANSSSLNSHLSLALSTFLAEHPQVNIELEEQNSEDIVLAVHDGSADLGVVAGSIESGPLHATPYAEDRLILAVPRGHALAGSGEMRLLDGLPYDFVCMNRTSSNFQFLQSTASRLGHHLRVRIHVHSFDAVLDFVAAGVGIALVPQSIYAKADGAGRCVALDLSDSWAHRSLKLVTRDIAREPPFVRALRNHLTRYASPGSGPINGPLAL